MRDVRRDVHLAAVPQPSRVETLCNEEAQVPLLLECFH